MDTTVVKALTILEALADSDRPRGVTELGVQLGLTRANVHRLLRTLLSMGYVTQDEKSAYQLSLKMWQLGAKRVAQRDLLTVAQPLVRYLCEQLDESVQLLIPDGLTVVCVDKADSAQPLRATTTIGVRVPMHAVSGGKAILAFDSGIAASLNYPLESYTPSTITSRGAMEEQLSSVRQHGYAVNRGEWRAGIWGIAAPIFNAQHKVIAAISVWGAEARMNQDATHTLGTCVASVAAKISGELGCVFAGDTP